MSDNRTSGIPISVIIPVYNVYGFMDKCLESVVNQTSKEFEIILINDGSTDGSDQKCEQWAKKDRRIRYYSKQNEGPSKTRNYGLQKAKGEFVSFIDSDDWIDPTFLEKLYWAAVDANADMAECDVWRVNNHNGNKTRHICYGSMGMVYNKEERIMYGYAEIWRCLTKRKLWIENGVVFPDFHSQSKGVYPLLVALSNRVAVVQEGLYYYRKFRPNSLSDKPREIHSDLEAEGIQSYKYLLDEFRRCGLYEKYQMVIERGVKYRASETLAGMFIKHDVDAYQKRFVNYCSFVEKAFHKSVANKFAILGGYNLTRATWYVNFLNNALLRFSFSSLISIVNPVQEDMTINHPNAFRKRMIERDIHSLFWNIIKDSMPDYLILDLLEERFDVIQWKGGYITKSDAFDEMEYELEGCLVIKRDSKECDRLWEESCDTFLNRLHKTSANTRIIIVENYLSEKKGDSKHIELYDNYVEINRYNAVLKEYYGYLKRKCSDAIVISVSDSKYYYTDLEYEYGVIPSHLNDIVNREMSVCIEKVLGNGED